MLDMIIKHAVSFVVVPVLLVFTLELAVYSQRQDMSRKFKVDIISGALYLLMLALRILVPPLMLLNMSASSFVRMAVMILPVCFLRMRREGHFGLTVLRTIAIMLLSDMVAAAITMITTPPNMVVHSIWVDTDASSLLYAVPQQLVGSLLVCSVHGWIRREWERVSSFMFYLMAAFLAMVALAVMFLPTSSLDDLIGPTFSGLYRFTLLQLQEVVISILLILIDIYLIGSRVKYQISYNENRTLRQQEALMSAMLREQRTFRHNLMNELQGLIGTIDHGDISSIRAYQTDLYMKARMVNNENYIVLQKILSPGVRGLLLRHMEMMREQSIPFYMNADAALRLRSMKDIDLCAILGVLLDNAREAAASSRDPFVQLEVRSIPGSVEFVLRNSCEDPPDMASLMVNGYSTKQGERGIGLESVRTIMKRYPKSQLVTSLQGSYVVQHLVIAV